jgi:hypothetical protein
MLRALSGLPVFLSALLATPSCGGQSSSSGGNCSQAMPCGGNLVGTWQIISSCATGTAVMPSSSCPGETTAVTSVNDTGSLTFNADGTYTAMISASAQEAAMVPQSCVSTGRSSLTCDQVAMALSGPLTQADGGAVSGSLSTSCTASGSNCSCNIALSISGASATGTYAASGTSVAITPNGGGPTSDGYCVQGNTLHLYSNGSSAMTGMTSMPAADLVATRQ